MGFTSASPPPPPKDMLPSVDPEHNMHTGALAGRPTRRHFNRSRQQRPPRPPVHDNLVQSLNENSRLLRETIVQAAEILAAAIRSVSLPVVFQNNYNPEDIVDNLQ